MTKILASPLPLAGVLALALALRIWGLTWGLPSATHYFSYHPDESVVLEAAMTINVFAGHLLPGFYNYGSLQLYLVNCANWIVFLLDGVNIVIKDLATDYAQWARMYLIGRSLTVAMGVGTVWATYALGRRLWGRGVGLLAALLLAIMPLHAQHSHFLTVDVPATFWVILSLLWTAKADEFERSAVAAASDSAPPPLPKKHGGARAIVWSAIFAGLAAATKYNMVVVLLPLLLVCVSRNVPVKTRILRLLLSGGICAAAFLVGCPGAVLDRQEFLGDLNYEAVHVSRQPGPTFENTGSGFVYTITHNFNAGLGLPLLLFVLGSLVYAAVRRERGDGLLAAFALPYYVLISLAAVRYARYTLPLLPLLALWGGRGLAALLRAHPWPLRFSREMVAVAVLGLTLLDCISIVCPMAQADPRDRALSWLQRTVPPAATISFATLPWFQTPPLDPYFSLPQPGAWQHKTPPEANLHPNFYGRSWNAPFFSRDWDVVSLQQRRPNFVIVTEYGYSDALRLGDRQALAFLATLHHDYLDAATFTAPPPLFRLRQTRNGLPVQDLPHDMLYPEPAVLIYQRKK